MSFLNELYSLFFRVRDLSQKMGYGQGHMQMGLAEKKGLFTWFIYLVYLPLSLCTDILSEKTTLGARLHGEFQPGLKFCCDYMMNFSPG